MTFGQPRREAGLAYLDTYESTLNRVAARLPQSRTRTVMLSDADGWTIGVAGWDTTLPPQAGTPARAAARFGR
jgi:hypothetical protein